MEQTMTPTDVYRTTFRQVLSDYGYDTPITTTFAGRKAIKSAMKIAKKAARHFKKTGQVPSSAAINGLAGREAQQQQIPMIIMSQGGGMGGTEHQGAAFEQPDPF